MCDPLPWLVHPHARVRREALRVALRLGAVRDRALAVAFRDTDEWVLAQAAKGAFDYPSRGVVPGLLELARREELDDELRALVIEALVRASQGPETLDLLREIVIRDSRRLRWLARGAASRTVAAARSALAMHQPHDARSTVAVGLTPSSHGTAGTGAPQATRP